MCYKGRMRTPRTTIAQLRAIIGLRAKELADVLGCSVPTINSIETGRLRLSETMAQRICHETGIPLRWLLAGDLSALPMGRDGKPYSAASFEAHQSRKQRADKLPPVRFAIDFANFAGRLRDILAAANKAGGYALTAYKVGRFMDGMERAGGAPASDWPAVREAMLRDIGTADAAFARLAEMSAPGGHDVAELHKALAPKPTKKGAPLLARPKSRKR